jgi:hypothetical protein
MLALIICILLQDRIALRKTAQNNGIREPEFRLIIPIYFQPFIFIGLFIYGWTAQHKVQWMAPIVGSGLFGFGFVGIYTPMMTYLIESFGFYSASALAAATVERSILGAVLPLAGPKLFESLGLGWGNSYVYGVNLSNSDYLHLSQ